jgi:hypothetical protein
MLRNIVVLKYEAVIIKRPIIAAQHLLSTVGKRQGTNEYGTLELYRGYHDQTNKLHS